MNGVAEELIGLGKKYQARKNDGIIEFLKENEKANILLNDLKDHPHIFVIACLMDRQIKAERAWEIPYTVLTELQMFNVKELATVSKERFLKIFKIKNLHRFNEQMAAIFYDAIQKIHKEYKDNAALIWMDNPSSATVVSRFLEFNGAGIKIATMATNILVRDFKIPLSDYYSLDISPDVHVCRVFKRLGIVPETADKDQVIYAARAMYPKYPGIFDLVCWDIGRNYCHPSNPDCKSCFVNNCINKIQQKQSH